MRCCRMGGDMTHPGSGPTIPQHPVCDDPNLLPPRAPEGIWDIWPRGRTAEHVKRIRTASWVTLRFMRRRAFWDAQPQAGGLRPVANTQTLKEGWSAARELTGAAFLAHIQVKHM